MYNWTLRKPFKKISVGHPSCFLSEATLPAVSSMDGELKCIDDCKTLSFSA